jgi:hypothetical protein
MLDMETVKWARENLARLETEAQSGNPEKLSFLGLAHLGLGHSEMAIECCQKAFDQRPTFTNTRNLVVVLAETHRRKSCLN